ncbi:phage tail protein [Bartonella sp. HY761]|uniref:phage tail protein n=1 Tax=Bartonella sp. HY761 TaxID=2979330 RepID=UPI002203C69F|nr:phage tail protein [Bartonella sp. HY761]UXN05247.1 phage tail protein [Bartonella sp. HY761]
MAGVLSIGWSNEDAIKKFAGAVHAVGDKLPIAAMRAANHTGQKAKTKVVRALTKQTGLKRKTIVKAVREYKANPSRVIYILRSSGKEISLRHFGARETKAGVSAAPFGKRQIFAKSFIYGGQFPNREKLAVYGQVMIREGAARLPITKVLSGVTIPDEMIKGETKEAFDGVVNKDLAPRLYHELKRLMP